MKYMFIVFRPETNCHKTSDVDVDEVANGSQTFSNGEIRSATIVSDTRIQPASTAKTVQVKKGKTELNDGPAEQTNTQFSEFYIVEASDLDVAIAVAARIPIAQTGAIEIRPIKDCSQRNVDARKHQCLSFGGRQQDL